MVGLCFSFFFVRTVLVASASVQSNLCVSNTDGVPSCAGCYAALQKCRKDCEFWKPCILLVEIAHLSEKTVEFIGQCLEKNQKSTKERWPWICCHYESLLARFSLRIMSCAESKVEDEIS